MLRSRDPEEVIRQAQQLVDAGYKEIVLTGIHTGGYGEDMKDYNFAQLLKELDSRVKGLKESVSLQSKRAKLQTKSSKCLTAQTRSSDTFTSRFNPAQTAF
ncbi:hypothetical protein PO124_17455 [Bacillus licheniformis]|nr:hypothetical protein [Bacillus licheniformis]